MNKIDSFIYNTVRIECPNSDGTSNFGTGFFVQFNPNKNDFTAEPIKLLLTNKHVVKNSTTMIIKLCEINSDGSPNNQSHISIKVCNLQNCVINHPNEDVDLCAIPHSILKKAVDDAHLQAYATFFKIDKFTAIEEMNLSAIEDVISIGYPRTRIDQYNNKPIVRKGITATHPGLKYDGQDVFLIDIPCYTGCSGSPVFLYSPFIKHSLTDNGENYAFIDYRIELLGIVFKTAIAEFEGTTSGCPYDKNNENDNDKDPAHTVNLQLPINLGLAINKNQIHILLLEAAKVLKPST